ncbi:hypothetical protein Tco_0742559 [Tanacetum coccineum]
MPFLSTDITGYEYWLWVVSSGSSFVFAVPGHMTYPVASPTLDSARSYVMQGAPFTQGMIPSIPSIPSTPIPGHMTYPVASLTLGSARSYVMQGAPFTQGTIPSIPNGGNISPEGFLSSILLLVVIIITVLIVAVILVVVVIAFVEVVIVVVFIGIVVVVVGVSSIFKLSFVIIGVLRRIMFYCLLHQPLSYGNGFLRSLRSSSRSGVPVGITSTCHCCDGASHELRAMPSAIRFFARWQPKLWIQRKFWNLRLPKIDTEIME